MHVLKPSRTHAPTHPRTRTHIRPRPHAQAGSNFDHIVQSNKDSGHQLVTTGVYTYLRHPSYCGWFWWSIGTQVLLCNPLCIVAYAVACVVSGASKDRKGRVEESSLGGGGQIR